MIWTNSVHMGRGQEYKTVARRSFSLMARAMRHTCVYVCVYVCVYTHLCVCVSVCACECVFIRLCVYASCEVLQSRRLCPII